MLLIVGVGDIYYSSIYHMERYCDGTIHHSCLIIGFMPCVDCSIRVFDILQ